VTTGQIEKLLALIATVYLRHDHSEPLLIAAACAFKRLSAHATVLVSYAIPAVGAALKKPPMPKKRKKKGWPKKGMTMADDLGKLADEVKDLKRAYCQVMELTNGRLAVLNNTLGGGVFALWALVVLLAVNLWRVW
jgi:hypothetical protein